MKKNNENEPKIKTEWHKKALIFCIIIFIMLVVVLIVVLSLLGNKNGGNGSNCNGGTCPLYIVIYALNILG